MSHALHLQAGGICDVSGLDIPFPGYYMTASDGANFGLLDEYYATAKGALEAALAEGGGSDVAWKARSSVRLDNLEAIELTELLCYAVRFA